MRLIGGIAIMTSRGKRILAMLNTDEEKESHHSDKKEISDKLKDKNTSLFDIENMPTIMRNDLLLSDQINDVENWHTQKTSAVSRLLLDNQSVQIENQNWDNYNNIILDCAVPDLDDINYLDLVIQSQNNVFTQLPIVTETDLERPHSSSKQPIKNAALVSGQSENGFNTVAHVEEQDCSLSKVDKNEPGASLNQGLIRHTTLVPYEISDEASIDSDKASCYQPSSEEEIVSDRNSDSEGDRRSSRRPSCEDMEMGNVEEINKARKRRKVADPNEWKRLKNKKLRMEGKAYLGYSKKENGKIEHNMKRGERKMKPTCNSIVCRKSHKRNCSKFNEEVRQNIFNTFWKEMDWSQRQVFVSSNVMKTNTARGNEESRRQGTYTYFLNTGVQRLQVCRQMFINTLDIGYKTVQDWVSKSLYGMASETSNNLIHVTKERYTNQYKLLRKFFDQLPKLPAHYCRRDTLKLYLEESFHTLSDLYKIYVTFCREKDDEQPLNRKIFRKIFHEKNLSLFKPKKDQCNVCFSYKYNNIDQEKWTVHIENKNKAREEKTKDKKLAEERECIGLTMDLQAVKLSPYLPAGKIYFKTKLCCHNFTIYNLANRDVTCYWFSEDQNNQLCASTFTSCIIDYLETKCITTSKLPIVMYSDGCGFQNRNNVLANALLNFAIKNRVTIYQKYLEPGHTQMECDSVHSLIERKLRNREIHLPSDYCTVSKECRVTPKPYDVKILEHDFFKNYSESKYLRYTSIRPGRKAFDPVITDIKCIKYESLPTPEIKVKLSYEKPYIELPVRPKSMPVIEDYPALLKGPCKVKKEKWQHLQELKTVLPKDTHAFYDNLSYQ